MAVAQISWLQLGEAVAPAARLSWLQIDGQPAAPAAPAARLSWLQIDGAPIESAPNAPTSVAGDATSESAATINWVDASGNESGFEVQLESPTGSGTWVTATGDANPTAPGVQSFAATGLAGATDYTPRVRALGATLNSAYATGAAFGTDNTGGGGGVIPLPGGTVSITDAGGIASGVTFGTATVAATYPPGVVIASVTDAGGIPSGVTFGLATVTRIGPVIVTPTLRIYVVPARQRIYRKGTMSYFNINGGQPTIDHDPDASLEYGIDFAGELADGDSIAGTPTVLAPGVTATGVRLDGTVAMVRCTGGAVGTREPVEFTVATNGGDTHQMTIYLRVVDR